MKSLLSLLALLMPLALSPLSAQETVHSVGLIGIMGPSWIQNRDIDDNGLEDDAFVGWGLGAEWQMELSRHWGLSARMHYTKKGEELRTPPPPWDPDGAGTPIERIFLNYLGVAVGPVLYIRTSPTITLSSGPYFNMALDMQNKQVQSNVSQTVPDFIYNKPDMGFYLALGIQQTLVNKLTFVTNVSYQHSLTTLITPDPNDHAKPWRTPRMATIEAGLLWRINTSAE